MGNDGKRRERAGKGVQHDTFLLLQWHTRHYLLKSANSRSHCPLQQHFYPAIVNFDHDLDLRSCPVDSVKMNYHARYIKAPYVKRYCPHTHTHTHQSDSSTLDLDARLSFASHNHLPTSEDCQRAMKDRQYAPDGTSNGTPCRDLAESSSSSGLQQTGYLTPNESAGCRRPVQ